MSELGFEPRLSGLGPGSLLTVLCCAPFSTKDKSKLAVEKRWRFSMRLVLMSFRIMETESTVLSELWGTVLLFNVFVVFLVSMLRFSDIEFPLNSFFCSFQLSPKTSYLVIYLSNILIKIILKSVFDNSMVVAFCCCYLFNPIFW